MGFVEFDVSDSSQRARHRDIAFGAGDGASLPRHMLKVGDAAPDFEVQAHTGETIRLSSLAGSPVVLWFYPKADTPG